MTLPIVPPTTQSPVIRRGSAGWPAYALQDALRATGAYLKTDGSFGAVTEAALITYQRSAGLTADGIAGPITQGSLVVSACSAVEAPMKAMPKGIMRGIALGESGLMLAAVNDTIAGGVDCGAVQTRVVGPPFDADRLKLAFSVASISAAAMDYRARRDAFLKSAWVAQELSPYKAAGLVAALAHNWPSGGGADFYAIHGHVENPSGACSWLPRDRNGGLVVRFPDGVLVRSRQDWADFYALGSIHGPGMITKSVTIWR